MTERTSVRATDAGFTLVEICVAMILTMLVATGVAELFALAIKVCDAARVQTSSAILASQKLEQLRALTWAVDATGLTLSDWTTDLSREPATGGGPGLGPSPANSLDANMPGYVDYLNSSGAWAGTGLAPPPSARYIRRWSVQPLTTDADVVVLQVLVTTVSRDRQAARPRRRLADEALVTTVLVRKSR